MRSPKGFKKKWGDDRNWLKEKNNEVYKLCDQLFNLMKLKERLMAKLTNNISELDGAAKPWSGHVIKTKEIEPCSVFSCLATQFDDN